MRVRHHDPLHQRGVLNMARNLVLCRSDAGDGGWSLHPPGTTDASLADGSARTLADGNAERCADGEWNRPNMDDRHAAWDECGPNTARSVSIEIVYGARSVDDADRERAATAAARILNEAGVSAAVAATEFQRQWLLYDDETPMTGLALVWIEARAAADIALTVGWANPCGASCTIIL